MNYTELIAGTGKTKGRRRVGRGNGSKGKTCGRGHKGFGQHAGKSLRLNYEGGQTAAFQRLPKRGFSNAQFETRYVPVNVGDLNRFPDGATVDKDALLAARLVRKKTDRVKILGNGTLQRKLDVAADKFSRAAVAKIEAAGGSVRQSG